MRAESARLALERCPDQATADSLLERARELGLAANNNDKARIAEAVDLAIVAHEYFRAVADPRGIQRTLTWLSWLCTQGGDYLAAVRYARKALRYVRHADDPEGATLYLEHSLAISYTRLQDFVRAEDALRHVLAAADRRGNRRLAANAYFGLSRVYQKQGRIDESLGAAVRALHRFSRLDEQAVVAGLRNNIGMLLAERGDYARATGQLQRALMAARKLGDVAVEANTLTELARVSLRVGRIDSADGYARQSLRLTLEVLHEEIRLARLYVVFAGIFEARGEIERAAHYIDEAVELFEANKNAQPDLVEFAAACACQQKLRRLVGKEGKQ